MAKRLEKDLGEGIKVRAIDEGSDTNGETLWGWVWFDELNDAKWTRRMPTLGRKQVAEFALWCCLPGNPGSPHSDE
jgi:hypothetical protein